VIGVDNDGDQPKERERLMYLLEGSDTGWRNQHQYQTTDSRWMKENMWMPAGAADQPLTITPPIANYSDGPAGFLFEPGHALDGDLRGHFILDQFPKGKMDAFTLVPDRDSFRQENLRVINDGLMGIGMTWGIDGRAYFADWIGGYPLDGKGAIWSIDVAPNIDKSSEAVLSKPFTVEIPKDELLGLLGHQDQRVRVNASIRLHRLGAWSEMLALALKADSPRFARIHAIWGYGMGVRLGKVADATAAVALLEDADAEIRVQMLKVLSEGRPSQLLTDKVAAQLAQQDFRVRTQAGITLTKLGGKVPFTSFLRDAEPDLRLPWLRHGLVSGLAGTQSSEDLVAFAQSKTGAEAVFATLALARKKSPLLSKLLAHANPEVVTEAARAIHDDEGIPAAQPALAAAFGQPNLPFHAARRALNANLRQGDEAALQRVLTWAIAQPEGAPLRLEALNTLLVFDQPPVLDFVDGTARKYPAREIVRLAALIRAKQDDLLSLQRPEERARALSLLVKYEAELPFSILQSLAEDLKASPAVRLQTLRLLGRRSDEAVAVTRTLRHATGEGNPSEVRVEALTQLFSRDVTAALEVSRQIIDSKAAKMPEKQAVIAALRGRTEPSARKLLQELVTRLAARKLDSGLKLDVYELAVDSNDPAIADALKKYLSPGKGAPKLAAPGLPYELLTEGGDASRGKLLVNGHLAANCTACHRIDSDEGSEVGPMLRLVGSVRSRVELAESLVEPSAKIVPGFGIESIVLKDGTTLAGSVLKENAKSLDLKLADGKTQKVAVPTIASRTPPVSVMPPMLGILTPAEIRDVVAYLSGLKPKATKAKSEKPKK
jgi:putative heme-binding domain-containing protein